MKPDLWSSYLALCLAGLAVSVVGQSLQTVSLSDPGQPPPPGGSGDSLAPVLSPDGRFVLFASTADNFILTTNHTTIPNRIPAILNVFLRDRVNKTTALVSVNLSGVAGGDGDSLPIGISTNGQFVLFESSASDLVIGDANGVRDIFLRDMINSNTVLVSVGINGMAGNGVSRSATLTPDGRYVAFVSSANNLVAGDTNGIPDVFIRDLQANTTALVSTGARRGASSGAVYSSESPEISDDGRYVAFYSTATNLVGGVPAGGDIYVRDLVAGATIWASAYARVAVSGAAVYSFSHALSADGQFVAYEAAPSTNLTSQALVLGGSVLRFSQASGVTDIVHTNAATWATAPEDYRGLDMTPDGRWIAFLANVIGKSGSNSCVLLWDANTATSSLVSGNQSGQVPTNSVCDFPAVDPSGRYVAFLSGSAVLTTNSAIGDYHLYLRDTLTATTTLLDAGSNGVGSPVAGTMAPVLSSDARFVAFECADAALVPDDRNHDTDVFVRDLASGTVDLVSAHNAAFASGTANGISMFASSSLSSDGQVIVFSSEADNLVRNDTNGVRDVFVRDLNNGTTILVSAATNGMAGDNISSDPTISPDGRYVAFASSADDLVPGDTNRTQDVFVRDLQTGASSLVSVKISGTGPGNAASSTPIISEGGRFVLFRSKASNLASGVVSPSENLFLRDRSLGATYALTTIGVYSAAITPDGHFVAVIDDPGPPTGKIYIWDSLLARRIYTNSSAANVGSVALSPDGRRLGYVGSSGSVFGADRFAASSWVILGGAPGFPPSGLRFSTDGRWLTYSAGTKQVYLYDFQIGANVLVSHAAGSSAAANGASDSPDVSADGRFVAYRSAAINLLSGITNGLPVVVLYDRQTGSNTLLSPSRSGSASPNARSLIPVFSGDGRTLVFQSWASDLAAGDFNHASDLFAYEFLYATIQPGGSSPGISISWPSGLGGNYKVQYKDAFNGSAWQDLSGVTTNHGTRTWFQDASPGPAGRFYRVVSTSTPP